MLWDCAAWYVSDYFLVGQNSVRIDTNKDKELF